MARRNQITADQQRTINARRNATVELSTIDNAELVTKAFAATRLNDCDADDAIDAYNLNREVSEEEMDLKQIALVLGSETGRKYAAAKLRELADLIDVLN